MSLETALPAGTPDPPPDEAELLIIGGGVMGLSVAFNAARLGQKGIVVLERSHLCAGASGRNGGGVRTQWSTAEDVALMKESVEICRRFAAEMGINIWFRQGGYLFLVKNDAFRATLEANVAIQNACGSPTRILEPNDAKKIVPGLDVTGLAVASFNPNDGVLFPWPFLYGYATRAIELGVAIHTFAEVERLEVTQGHIDAVHARSSRQRHASSESSGMSKVRPSWEKRMRVRHVVNATGAWSALLARQAGLELPNHPVRHEILATEALKPFLDPMVSILDVGVYFSQSMRGEIVGGMGDRSERSSFDQGSTLRFVRRFASAATRLLPALGNVRVLRQWAGLYDVSPDGRPIIGESASVPNMTHLAGFTGHGFMMAPIIGKMCAERLVKGAHYAYFDGSGPDRFATGVAMNKESMIIG